MEGLREVARRYVKAMESAEEARRKLVGVIIKYLIANDIDLGKCTELAISQNLGLPRSIVRRILSELVDEGILEVKSVGNVKPYMFTMVGVAGALDFMGLSFTREEINEFLRAKEADKLDKSMIAASVMTSTEVKGKRINRYRGYAADLCLNTLIGRFLECIEEERELGKKIRETIGEKALKELELLSPELMSFKKLEEAPVELLLLFGFDSVLWRIMDNLDKLSPGDIKKFIVEAYEEALKRAVDRFGRFASLLEEKGYEGLHGYFKGREPIHYKQAKHLAEGKSKFRFHDEYVWAATLALREGCIFGEKLGVDPNLIKEARQLAEILDLALEEKYRGIEAEDINLTEWGLKQISRLR